MKIQTHDTDTNLYAYCYAHICVCVITHIYIPSIQCVLLILWDFSLLVLQNSGKVFKLKGHFYFKQIKCCNTEKQNVY